MVINVTKVILKVKVKVKNTEILSVPYFAEILKVTAYC